MISTFDVFKIILGIIISVFILFIILRFTGSYTDISESSREVSTMISLKKTIEDVYTTGIETDFEVKDAEFITGYNPPYIETKVSMVSMDPVPLLLVPGTKISLHRNGYDIGWWKFYFIEAMPEANFLFVPLGEGNEKWSVTGNITGSLPSTENTKNKVKFGVGCNGSEFWFGWEGYKFIDAVMPRLIASDSEFSECNNTEYFREKGYVLVTVSDEMKEADFLVKPLTEDVGYVYIKGDEGYSSYVYKNSVDIAALLLGGQKLYEYENEKFFGELEVAIDVSLKKYALLAANENMNRRCGNEISGFVQTLNSIKEIVPKVKKQPKEDDAIQFAALMRESREKYGEIDTVGCG